MRELKRSIARSLMKTQGVRHFNRKKPGTNRSFFSENWREYYANAIKAR